MLYKLFRFILLIFIKLVYFIEYIYEEPLPESGAYIFCGKHISPWDPIFAVCGNKRQVNFMAKAELFNTKFKAMFFHHFGTFPVDRGKGDIEAIKQSFRILKKGDVLGIFAEGTCVRHNDSIKLMSGAFNIAYKTKVPIVPFGIYTKDYFIKPFKKVTVRVGKPISFDEAGFTDGSKENIDEVSAKFGKILMELSGEKYEN